LLEVRKIVVVRWEVRGTVAVNQPETALFGQTLSRVTDGETGSLVGGPFLELGLFMSLLLLLRVHALLQKINVD
jgi:hypothetical protein